jgi:phage-related protein
MPAVGPGFREVRIHVGGAYRIFYLATRADAVYVLHAFEKKTQKTSGRDLETGRQRFRAPGQLKLHDGKKEERR